MILPTIYSAVDHTRHIVKDKQSCECGAKHNLFPNITRTELRSIKFMHEKDVTCPKCKMKMN